MSQEKFSGLAVADYAVFGVTLGISAAIGIFFAVKDRKSNYAIEKYMLGGRSLGIVPVAFSLTVSFMSAVSLMGIPTEIFFFGTMYLWFPLATLIAATINAEFFVPLFYGLRISSIYEYLERRFSRPVRLLSTFLYLIRGFLNIGIVVYAPALALSAVTGFSLWGSILSTGLVCIFYTCLGGIKAVVWTDVFQTVVIVMGFLAIIIEGCIRLGGYGKVWRICEENGRIEFSTFEFDPRIRNTFWSIVVGGSIVSINVSQASIQRLLSCGSVPAAKSSVYVFWFAQSIVIILGGMIGTVMYAYFHGCDPLLTGKIGAADQLFPYLTLQLLGKYPGIPGLVISCIFSGSLSTVSTFLNSVTCVTIEDFFKPFTNWSERKYLWMSKGLVILFGSITIAVAYLASLLGGSLLQVVLSVGGIFGAPSTALFSIGALFPFVNSYGAFTGFLCGVGWSGWIFVGNRIYPTGQEFTRLLPFSTAECPAENRNFTAVGEDKATAWPTSNETTLPTDLISTTKAPPIADLYHVSYLYYSCMGFTVTLVIGMLVSLITGGWSQRKQVDPALLRFFFDHWMFKWLPKKFRDFMRFGIDPKSKTEIENDEKETRFHMSMTNTEKCLPKANEKTECEDSKMVYHNDSLSDSTNRRCIAVEDKMTVL